MSTEPPGPAAALTEGKSEAAPSDARADVQQRAAPDAREPGYVGLVTRAIGFVVDAAVINLIALVAEVGVGLVLSLFHLSSEAKTVLIAVGGAIWVLWTVAYFVGFWTATGQTLGSRLMQIRVVPTRGERLKLRRAVVRVIGLVLATLPLGAGFVPILFDSRRRGLQDYLARTVVVDAPVLAPSVRGRSRQPGSYGER